MVCRLENDWFVIGTVGAPNGLKGAFFVSGREDLVPKEVKKVLIGKTLDSATQGDISDNFYRNGKCILRTSLASDRDVTQSLRGMKIWVARSELKINPDKEYFWKDLIGKKIVDGKGLEVGSVIAVRNYGASDVLVVRSSDNLKETTIPFVSSWFSITQMAENFLTLQVDLSDLDEMWNELSAGGKSP